MYYLLLIQQLIASMTHIVSKDITVAVAPELVLILRAGLACTVFGLWIAWKRKKLPKIEKKDLPMLLLLGFLNIPANQYVFFWAVRLTTAPNVALAYALSPAFVILIAYFFLKEKIGPMKGFGVLIAVAGTFLVLLERGLNFGSDYFAGNLLGLSASFSWALYSVLGKKITNKYGAIYTTALTMISGYILYIPIFLLFSPSYDFSVLKPIHFAEIAYLGIGTSVIGYAIWFYALKKIEASKVSVFNNLQPIFTTVLSLMIFGTSISGIFIAGGLMIILGVFVTQRA